MRIETYAALGWAILGSAASLRRSPQGTPSPFKAQVEKARHFMEQVAPNIKGVATEANPKMRSDSKRKLLRFGPHIIPASKVDVASPVHGHGAPSNPTAPKNWKDMTIGQAIGMATGGNPGMGMQLITLGQIYNFINALWTGGDTTKPLKEIITAPQDPNGWTSHRTWKASDLCQDCSVLSVKSDIVYENGTRADISRGLYLHHTASLNLGLHMNTNWIRMCPNSQTTRGGINFQDFMPKDIPTGGILSLGTVDEYSNYFTAKDGKVNAGLPVSGNDLLYQMTEIVNYAKHDQKVFVQLDIEYVDGKLEKESTLTSLTFTGCNPVWGFTGNNSIGSITSEPFDVNYPGTVVNARGHMHDGGTSLDILLNNKTVCSSKAVYGTKMQTDGKDWTTISEMTDCTQAFKVKKGDVIKLVVNYDEMAHPKRDSHGEEQEEMGFMYFTFVSE